MFGPARGFTVGKFMQPGLANKMDIFHFDIAGRLFRRFQKQVDAGVFAVFDLFAEVFIAG